MTDIEKSLQIYADVLACLKATLRRVVDAWQQIKDSLRKVFVTYRVKYPIIRKTVSNYTPPMRKVQYRARSNC